MGRLKQSIYEDLIDIASEMPWWVGVGLAVLSYFLIHWYASKFGGNPVVNIFAGIFSLIIPLAFILGAIVSGVKQFKKINLLNGQISGGSLDELSWHEFELLISEVFRRQGYSVHETEFGPDGGIDLILKKDGETTLVQCKHWKVYKVGARSIRELQGVISTKKADSGIFVTSGEYTYEAIKFARECHIKLIDGDDLCRLFKSESIGIDRIITTSNSKYPLCPRCGSEMVKRTAKRGKNIGNKFWGCSTFPKCRVTMSID